MLRTLNDIHKYFFNVENLWEKLTSDESLISFYHIELEDIGLTDDLYIKMNARGKTLTDFENFKANFERYLDKSDIHKMDNIWTDLFWEYKTSKDEITTIWGKELEKVIKENDIAPGEFVKFRKVDKAPVETVIRKKSKNGKREVFIKNGFKDVWDCSILGRAEKDLKVNPNMKNLKTTFTQDIKDISEQEKKTAEFIRMKKEREAKQGLNLSSQSKGNKFGHLKKKEDLELQKGEASEALQQLQARTQSTIKDLKAL